jgi:lipid-A-disaccharide synthase
MKIGIIAAEPSGDLLGAGLIKALKQHIPNAQFIGIGGSQMQAQGMHSWEPIESLSVMGLVEVLSHLPRLLKIRKGVIQAYLENPPDVFIGIDAPDFNLTVEQHLHDAGIPTVHYVSPTVWAWRPKRVNKIRAAVDLLLSIFPFEQKFLQGHGVNTQYVGHTLAANMPVQVDRTAARNALNLDAKDKVLAILPGSRSGEITRLARPFLKTALACLREIPDLQIVVPLVNRKTEQLWHAQQQRYAPDLPVQVVMQNSPRAMAAADVLLVASGTATFEGLLSKRPMVVGYKLNALTYWLVRLFKLVKVDHVAMANLLSEERLAPEFIQAGCEADNLAPAVMRFFMDQHKVKHIQQRYTEIHQALRIDTDQRAAQAVLKLLQEQA